MNYPSINMMIANLEKAAYDRGAHDVWELLRYLYKDHDGLVATDPHHLKEIFEYDFNDVLDHYGPKFAMEKVQEYEDKLAIQRRATIKVGDELVSHDGKRTMIVTRVINAETGQVEGFGPDGHPTHGSCSPTTVSYWERTGRNFPQLVSVLTEITQDADVYEEEDEDEGEE